MDDYVPKTKPFDHQASAFERTADLVSWAHFWEQGTGKSKAAIDTTARLYLNGKIDALLVVAPMGVHLNWITDELPSHLPDRVSGVTLAHAWSPSSSGTQRHQKALERVTKHQGFAVLALPVESFTTPRCKKVVWDFLRSRRVMFVLDEGITIKSASAKRSISIVAAGRYAKYRRLLNGTPTAGEPWDVYQQIKFLDENFWRQYELDGIQVFRNHFGRWIEKKDDKGKKQYDLCVGYRRLDELKTILETISDRVTKEEVLDLPPKLYSKARFEMSPEQDRHYQSLKDEFLTWLDGQGACEGCGGAGRRCVPTEQGDYEYACEDCAGNGLKRGEMVAAELAITRMLRLQQITCGYLPTDKVSDEPFHVFKENPRLERFMAGALNLPHGCIVWCRFQKDAELIMEALHAAKRTAVRYDGTVKEADRARAKEDFQQGRAQFFVANPAAISMGVTLLNGKTMVYYSNSFHLVQRLQSEDRPHRIGQTSSVHIVDLIANHTVDEAIVKALREKIDVSRQITGDRIKEWI